MPLVTLHVFQNQTKLLFLQHVFTNTFHQAKLLTSLTAVGVDLICSISPSTYCSQTGRIKPTLNIVGF